VPHDPVLRGLPSAVRSDQNGLSEPRVVGAADVVGTIDVVGVVGAGTMGAGIAQLALEAGHEVFIHDVDAAAIERGRARIRTGLERRAARLDLDPESAEAWIDGRFARLHSAPTIHAIARAGPDLIVEAALEDLDAKRTIFRTIDGLVPPDAILATNTSALSVEAIAAATAHPMRVLGLHFFNPAPVLPLVEVVTAPMTDRAVADRAAALMTLWGKVPVRCIDTPGFIVNRVNRPFTLEALAMLEAELGSIETIDAALRDAGFPMGPFELMDLTGIDVTLAASGGIFERSRAAGDPLAERFRPSRIQERLVAAGDLGRKTGAGFYRYGPDGRATGPAGEVGHSGPRRHIPPAEIVARITLAIVNEAYRALGDGVASASDIDLAMRLGAAHPSGPFERAEVLGGRTGVLDGLRRHAAAGPRFIPAPALLAAR
jgi:3-hydroxybutyryl-CoA dehydrogenase